MVSPASWKIEHLTSFHSEGNGCGFAVQWVLGQVRRVQATESRAPLQRPLRLSVVKVLVVLRRKYSPALLADDLVDEVVLAVNVALCKSSR